MQETRYDGTEKITENADIESMKQAIDDPRNKRVTLHFVGDVFQDIDGNRMSVGRDGKLYKHPSCK